MAHLGELAALGTALCWTVTALAFEAAGRRVGSLQVNLVRLVLALGLLTGYGWLARGLPLPTDASAHAWGWLAASGLVGFCFGDLCLFRAFVLVGARVSMLVMSLVPPLTALAGFLLLGEGLGPLQLAGMGLTLAGVAWVVAERPRRRAARPERGEARRPLLGVVLALGGAVGQAVGLVMSKHGMGAYDAFAATQIRVLAGAAGFGLIVGAVGAWPRVLSAVRDRRAMAALGTGAFFGPFLGVTGSLLAVQHAPAGAAATIMSIVPVLIIAPSALLFGDRASPRSVAGAVLAVAGVALLFV